MTDACFKYKLRKKKGFNMDKGKKKVEIRKDGKTWQ